MKSGKSLLILVALPLLLISSAGKSADLTIAEEAALELEHQYRLAFDSRAYPIVQFLNQSNGENSIGMPDSVLVKAGSKDGITAGTTFKTYRSAGAAQTGGDPMWICTGRLKVTEVQDDYAIAELAAGPSAAAATFFPKFPGVMAGDLAVAPKIKVTRTNVVTPTTALSYFDLFEDPKSTPSSFELSIKGMSTLREAASAFAGAKLSLLMVEGYTDANGPSNANQVESYQRALTVRQFLIDSLGFDEKRVVAFGFGESELVDSSNAPGYIRANRRIVLKAVPAETHVANGTLAH